MALLTADARDKFGQAVIALRADDNVHRALAPDNLCTFRLRHAARHRDHHLTAGLRFLFLQHAQLAQLGIDLVRSPLADVAGVQNDHIRRVRRIGRGVAQRRQQIRHAGGIIDVHLAAIGLDEELFHGFFGVCRGVMSGGGAQDKAYSAACALCPAAGDGADAWRPASPASPIA